MGKRKQLGVSLMGLILVLSFVGFVGVLSAKLIPAYLEYMAVKKILSAMEAGGDLKGTVREIRYNFEKRNAIEDIKSVRGDDLEVTKDGAQAVVSATWSVRVPMVHNINACLDFYVTTAK